MSFDVLPPPHAAAAAPSERDASDEHAPPRPGVMRAASALVEPPSTTSNQKPPRFGISVCTSTPARVATSAQDAVVRDDAADAGADVREHARERGVEPREHVDVLLAAGRRGQLAAPPRVAHPRPALVDLGAGVALPSPPCRSRKPASGMTGDSTCAAMISAVRAARCRSEV